MVNALKKKILMTAAGALFAGAVAMRDKDNRAKVKRVLLLAKRQVKDYMTKVAQQPMVKEGKAEVKKKTKTVIKAAEKATKTAKKTVEKL